MVKALMQPFVYLCTRGSLQSFLYFCDVADNPLPLSLFPLGLWKNLFLRSLSLQYYSKKDERFIEANYQTDQGFQSKDDYQDDGNQRGVYQREILFPFLSSQSSLS